MKNKFTLLVLNFVSILVLIISQFFTIDTTNVNQDIGIASIVFLVISIIFLVITFILNTFVFSNKFLLENKKNKIISFSLNIFFLIFALIFIGFKNINLLI